MCLKCRNTVSLNYKPNAPYPLVEVSWVEEQELQFKECGWLILEPLKKNIKFVQVVILAKIFFIAA